MTKMKYIDSSDDELEINVLNNIQTNGSYVKYILYNFKLHDVTFREFSINLALAIHNFTDRIFKTSEIDKQYKKHKSQVFEKEHKNLLEHINLEDFNTILDTAYKLLNENSSLNVSSEEVKAFDILKEYQNKIEFSDLGQNPLILKQEFGAADLLAFSKLVTRNNKNTIKSYILKSITSNVTNVSYKLPIFCLKTLSEYHVIKSNGNTHSLIPEFGTYSGILSKIPKDEDKQSFINNIFDLIKNKKPDNDLHNNDIEHLDERIVHLLFITEMQRNNAVLFTAPMFLKLLQTNDKTEFPMSIGEAVSHCRGISKEYKELLPNHGYIDFDQKNISNKIKTADFLYKEGKLIINFFKEIKPKKVEQSKFSNFFNKLENAELVKKICKTDIDQISLEEINILTSYIYTQNPFLCFSEISEIKTIFNDIFTAINYQLAEVGPSINLKQNRIKLLDTLTKFNKYILLKDTIENIEKNITNIYKLFDTLQKTLQKNQTTFDNITNIIPKDTEECVSDIFQELLLNMKDWYDIDLDDKFLLGNEEEF